MSSLCWWLPCPVAGTSLPTAPGFHTRLPDPNQHPKVGKAEPGSPVWHPGTHLGVKCPAEALAAPLPIPGAASAGSPRFVLGLPDGQGRGSLWQRDTELLYSLWHEKCHPAQAWGISIPAASPHSWEGASLLRQTNADGLPGARRCERRAGQRGTFGVNMWRVGVPKAWLVASICFSKSLSGSFTHVSACMCLEREGEHILCLPETLPWE